MKEECWFCEQVLKPTNSPIEHYFVSYEYKEILQVCNNCTDGVLTVVSHKKIFDTLEEAEEHLIHIKLFGNPNENKPNKLKDNP